MSIHNDSFEHMTFSTPSSDVASAARSAFFNEFSQHISSVGAERIRTASNDEPHVIHLPAPEPGPEVHHGVKDGKPFTVTIEPWDPQAEK